METIVAAILAVGFAGGLVYGIATLREPVQLQCVTSTGTDTNTDPLAAKKFLELLGDAEVSMIIYDDGNDMDDSIYKNSDIVNAVKKKVEEYPEFRVRCLFNSPYQSLFRTELSGYQGCVEIRTRKEPQPRREGQVHFKIIDDGVKAYLSRHPYGHSEREYRIVDCSKVPEKHSRYVANVILGHHIEGFRRAFAAAT